MTFLLLKYFAIHKSSAFPPASLSSPELGALGPQGSGFAWAQGTDPSRAAVVGGGALTVRTRWGSPSAARGRQPHRCSTGGAGRPPAGSGCRHKGVDEPHALPHSPQGPDSSGAAEPGTSQAQLPGMASLFKWREGPESSGGHSYISVPFSESLLR